jgi:hypothetical protein
MLVYNADDIQWKNDIRGRGSAYFGLTVGTHFLDLNPAFETLGVEKVFAVQANTLLLFTELISADGAP